MRLGKREPDQPVIEPVAGQGEPVAEVRTTGDWLAAVVLPAVHIELAIDPTLMQGNYLESMYQQQFKLTDADGNGYVDREEAKRSAFFNANFALLDRDGDGKVFEEELLALVRQQAALIESRTVLNISDQGRNLFEILDVNRDQRLSRQEFAAAIERMPLWDDDGDGLLDAAEVPQHYRWTLGRGQPRGAGGPRVNDPGITDRRKSPVWFQKMDRNQDGELSRREFLGSDEQFQQLDQNGDGLIDPQEAAAVP